MNKSKAMKNLLDQLSAKQTAAQGVIDKPDATIDDIKAAQAEIRAIKERIAVQDELDAGKNFDEDGDIVKDKTPVNEPIHAEAKDNRGPFRNLGEQMIAIVRSSRPGAEIDNRLLAIQNASGANEAIPAEGGFLVQKDFSSEIIKNIWQTGQLASRCRKVSIGANSNGIKINGIDETSRVAGSRWGGVQGYWANEAATVTATKPSFRQIELTLNKLMAIYYATEELLQDASAMNGVLTEAFTGELMFKTEDGIFRGDGAGKPLGILSSGALVSVAKEAGQAADTIVFENVLKMWSRMLASSRSNSVWYINQDCEPQLYSMSLAVGAGGVPVYMPANGLASTPFATLFGRPVIPVEHASTVGDLGDIVLADMSQYLLADKGGMDFASSMHVKFLYDEMTFRVTYRVDGQPMLSSAITPYKGSNTLSPFVALAARA